MGTAAEKLPEATYPNAYPGATPAFAKYTRFDNSGNIIGEFGVENVVAARAHSSYNALQTSLSGTVPHGGPGILASYTWSKSIDDISQVIGGTGSTGAVLTRLSAESVRLPSGTRPIVLRHRSWLRLERGAGYAS